jgi:hypothetical protein
MAAFLFARALNRTEEFRLASNLDGAGAFDDLVFRYRLRETGVWKTCFIQLKHRKIGGTVQRSSLTQMSGDFSLLKYFKSFCEIKNNAATDSNLKECGPFDDFEFVIYTNEKMENNSSLQGGDTDPLNILISGKDKMYYKSFDETHDKNIFEFFEELSRYHELITELDSLLRGGTFGKNDINLKIETFRNTEILKMLNKLQSNLNQDYITRMTKDLPKYDFTLYIEFLTKVKIFQNQSNEVSLQGLIEKELQQACKASPSVANFIYTKFEEGFSKWWVRNGNVVWLNENSALWQAVQDDIINVRNKMSYTETQANCGSGIPFSQEHLQKFSEALEQNTLLNIVTNSKIPFYQALNKLDYKNSLFIDRKSLILPEKNLKSFWPCKWCDVLVVDFASDCSLAKLFLEKLQNSDDSKQLLETLQKYQHKLIFFSPLIKASELQKNLRHVYTDLEVNFENTE